MAETPSVMVSLGTPAPQFRLPDPRGEVHSLDDFKNAPALLVAFICNHCPFVKHIRKKFSELAKDYQSRGVAVVAINSNDSETYPEDGPAKMADEIKAAGYTFPYLYDESQDVARAYHAACTPDFFLFDRDRKLVYRGQFDDSRPNNGRPATGKDLSAAIDTVLAGKAVSTDQKPSIGCNIKWKTAGAAQGRSVRVSLARCATATCQQSRCAMRRTGTNLMGNCALDCHLHLPFFLRSWEEP